PMPDPSGRLVNPADTTLPTRMPSHPAPALGTHLPLYGSTRSPRQPNLLSPQRRGSPGHPLGSQLGQIDPRLMSPRVVELNDEESKPVPSPSPIKHLPPDQLAHSQLNSISNNHEMISSSTIVPSINALMNGPSTSSLPNLVDGAKPGEHQK